MTADQQGRSGMKVVGMLHAPALPGAPGYAGDWAKLRGFVLRDALALVEGGVHGLMLENFGDVPFFSGRVPAEVVACLTRLACDVKREIGEAVPLGINVLRNDGESALAVASACGAAYVRVNVLSGAVVTDQGVIQGDAARLLRRRKEMGAEEVAVWADVRVKHAAPIGQGWRPLEEEVEELVLRAGASGVIVSGSGTGKATDMTELREVRDVMNTLGEQAVPIWVGSGATADTAAALLEHADGLIVGTSVKADGQLGRAVEAKRVKALMDAVPIG
ncbi:MAG: BtpA/SgcQ family protein [Planctomycetota bacterium]